MATKSDRMVIYLDGVLPIKSHEPFRGGYRTAATSKIEHFVIIVNGQKPLAIITKCSILDIAAVL